MNNIIKWIRHVPGWLYVVVIFSALYLTGLHTEVVGQLQRIILATGLLKPKVEPVINENSPTENASARAALPVADYNFSLRTINGESVAMESLQGKVIFMNFWATWCPPCIAEMPNIQSLYDKVKSDKIAFVMVSLDQEPLKAKKYISRKGFTFPVYTPGSPLPTVYAGQVIPSTFVISPAGYIVLQKAGMADYDNQEFRDFLQNLAENTESL